VKSDRFIWKTVRELYHKRWDVFIDVTSKRRKVSLMLIINVNKRVPPLRWWENVVVINT